MKVEDPIQVDNCISSPEGQVVVSVISTLYDGAMKQLLFTKDGLESAQGKAQAYVEILSTFERISQEARAERIKREPKE